MLTNIISNIISFLQNSADHCKSVLGNDVFTPTQTSMSVQIQLLVNRLAQTLMAPTAAPATQDIHWHLTYTVA